MTQSPPRPCAGRTVSHKQGSVRANSTEASAVASPSRGILNEVFEFNRNLQLDVPGDTIPNTYNPDDYIQSATEVATPSVNNTPDLGAADQAVQEGKKFIDTLSRLTSNTLPLGGSPSRSDSTPSVPTLLLADSPSLPQEQLQNLPAHSIPPRSTEVGFIPSASPQPAELDTQCGFYDAGSGQPTRYVGERIFQLCSA